MLCLNAMRIIAIEHNTLIMFNTIIFLINIAPMTLKPAPTSDEIESLKKLLLGRREIFTSRNSDKLIRKFCNKNTSI